MVVVVEIILPVLLYKIAVIFSLSFLTYKKIHSFGGKYVLSCWLVDYGFSTRSILGINLSKKTLNA